MNARTYKGKKAVDLRAYNETIWVYSKSCSDTVAIDMFIYQNTFISQKQASVLHSQTGMVLKRDQRKDYREYYSTSKEDADALVDTALSRLCA